MGYMRGVPVAAAKRPRIGMLGLPHIQLTHAHPACATLQKERNPNIKAELQTQLTKLEQAVRDETTRRKRSRIADDLKV